MKPRIYSHVRLLVFINLSELLLHFIALSCIAWRTLWLFNSFQFFPNIGSILSMSRIYVLFMAIWIALNMHRWFIFIHFLLKRTKTKSVHQWSELENHLKHLKYVWVYFKIMIKGKKGNEIYHHWIFQAFESLETILKCCNNLNLNLFLSIQSLSLISFTGQSLQSLRSVSDVVLIIFIIQCSHKATKENTNSNEKEWER